MKNYNFSATQDWHHYFKVIFNNTQIKNMLEFGLGDGTEFFLDNCGHTTSLEISLGDYNKSWYDKCVEKYKNYINWEPIYVLAPQEIVEANDLATKNRYPINYDGHISKIQEIINPILSKRNYDFIFVDAGFHNRGDLVNLSFGHAPIIAAHDTSRDSNRILKNIYGYNIIQTPYNYEEIHFEDTYMGTTIWIDRGLKLIIESLKKFKVNP